MHEARQTDSWKRFITCTIMASIAATVGATVGCTRKVSETHDDSRAEEQMMFDSPRERSADRSRPGRDRDGI